MTEETRKALHSSKKDDWGTPIDFFNKLDKQYNFTVDLCASHENALLPRYVDDVESGVVIDKEWGDGLPIEWNKEVFFCNPPYGKKLKEVLSFIPDSASGVFLLPARPDTKWFFDLSKKSDWVFFLKGRIKFFGAENPAPFPSVLVGMNVEIPAGISGILCQSIFCV